MGPKALRFSVKGFLNHNKNAPRIKKSKATATMFTASFFCFLKY